MGLIRGSLQVSAEGLPTLQETQASQTVTTSDPSDTVEGGEAVGSPKQLAVEKQVGSNPGKLNR